MCPRLRYLFIFSLATRELLQHVYLPQSANTHDTFIMARLNASHLLTVHLTWTKTECTASDPGDPWARPTYYSPKYRLNLYPLGGTLLSTSPEILITDSIMRNLRPREETNLSINEGYLDIPSWKPPLDAPSWTLPLAITLDHLGRVWFPYLRRGTVTITPVDDHIAPSMHMDQLPRSACSRWVVLDKGSLTAIEQPISRPPETITNRPA